MKQGSRRILRHMPMWVALSLLLTGCFGPSIVVRHEDPMRPEALVFVDGAQVGEVRHGEEFKIDVARGMHSIDVRPVGSSTNEWSDDGGGWTVAVDVQCVVTLMTPPERDDVDEDQQNQ